MGEKGQGGRFRCGRVFNRISTISENAGRYPGICQGGYFVSDRLAKSEASHYAWQSGTNGLLLDCRRGWRS